ncbi:extracellular solute-binding protein family 1 [Ruminiclostridium papyrosolvens DSM 2782]|uniref:Extracellular solute-binding protein family 1 n=1 Tax=Ruminiclostridium papyrosolvens DSM 2782 TaxID=588581 RepID=F1T993_9FIRM|nr:extracellular solute-binding protein [Ruminiclostridium papyrosolvens]EGD49075.1 extracellular solute-binding protein family 1 [Ruminiclostridium papyrosolvens DSM 2782]WES35555.1 extracellular solute-binding protein [Ruminiclostridium papyrosolvens DSM 2782]
MKKIFTVPVAAILAASLLLGGCGGQSGKTNPSDQSSSAEKEKMVLATVSDPRSKAILEMIDKKIKTYDPDNKFNVEIQMETYEVEQYKTKITTLMASNSQPDIFYTYEAGFMKPFVDGGKIYPISDTLEKDTEWKDRFQDGVFKPLSFDGKIYGIPLTKQLSVMFYNKKLFNEAGIAGAPKTYDEFLKDIDAFKKKNIIPVSLPSQRAWLAGELMQQLTNGVGGEDLYNKICDGTAKWDDPRFIEAATLFSDLVKKDSFQKGFLGMSQDEGRDQFRNEKAAMFYTISSDFEALTAEDSPVGKNLDFFMLPPVKTENGALNVGSIGNTFAISMTAKNIPAAAALIKTFSDKDMQENIAYTAKQFIVTKQKLDETKMAPLAIKFINATSDIKVLTPWFDRIFGSGEGTEFNNTAVAIAAGKDPADQMKKLQKFAEDNKNR